MIVPKKADERVEMSKRHPFVITLDGYWKIFPINTGERSLESARKALIAFHDTTVDMCRAEIRAKCGACDKDGKPLDPESEYIKCPYCDRARRSLERLKGAKP